MPAATETKALADTATGTAWQWERDAKDASYRHPGNAPGSSQRVRKTEPGPKDAAQQRRQDFHRMTLELKKSRDDLSDAKQAFETRDRLRRLEDKAEREELEKDFEKRLQEQKVLHETAFKHEAHRAGYDGEEPSPFTQLESLWQGIHTSVATCTSARSA
ncbi:unnamed protein product [Symbiodinium necroappetens]|uniref:Uncharacterized protein n=1 Tax=Symbiodinium necroappetens TaxID=1628268 RepID=A0A812UHC1_9DINO|nr:unnamed protein product [Symbiodinium necroappetens]